MELTKNCTKCKEDLPLDEFNSDSRRKDGKRSSCRICDAAHKKRVRDDNIEEYREKNRKANQAYRERQKFKNINE